MLDNNWLIQLHLFVGMYLSVVVKCVVNYHVSMISCHVDYSNVVGLFVGTDYFG